VGNDDQMYDLFSEFDDLAVTCLDHAERETIETGLCLVVFRHQRY